MPAMVTLAVGMLALAHLQRALDAAPTTPQVEEGYVTAPDGVRLFYQKVGDGRAKVIIPGRLFVYDDFKHLTRGRTLVFYDMRNRGRSDAVTDTTAMGIRSAVSDLEAVRRHFGFERVSLVGYSYLGFMVVLYAVDYPDRVERIVQLGPVPRKFGTEYPKRLVESDPGVDSAAWQRLRQQRAAGLDTARPKEYCELEWSVLRSRLVGKPANVNRLGPGPCDMKNEWPANLARHFRYALASVQQLDVPADSLARVTVPVLTIHGTRDRNAPYGAGREWAMTLPNARLLTVRGAAHQSWAEEPVIVLTAIDRFLADQWPAGAERVSSLDAR